MATSASPIFVNKCNAVFGSRRAARTRSIAASKYCRMYCSSVAYSAGVVESSLKKLDGIKNVEASFAIERAIIDFDPNKVNLEKISIIQSS